MLRVFFKYEGAVFKASEVKALENLEEFVINDDGYKAWEIAGASVKFTIELCPTRDEDEGAIFHQDHKDMRWFKKKDDRVASLDECADRLKDVLDKDTFAHAVRKMPRLETLIINLYQKWRDDEEVDIDSDDDDTSDIQFGLQLRLRLLHKVREGVASIFRPIETPGITHLSKLTYLRLTLPCAYDIAHVASCIPEEAALRLRHLYPEIVDGTGPGGDRDYLRSYEGYDDPTDGDENYVFSNLQRKYPNINYMSDICGFIERCKNIENVDLVGTQCINLETLNWKLANDLVGLKNIYMSRVRTTSDKLLSLLVSGGDDNCRIEAFDIKDVEMMDGTWEAIFAHLLTSPSLIHFNVLNLIYNKHGSSAHLAEHNNRPWENVSAIWTEHRQDKEMLRKLIRTVEGRGIKMQEEMAEFAEYEERFGAYYDNLEHVG